MLTPQYRSRVADALLDLPHREVAREICQRIAEHAKRPEEWIRATDTGTAPIVCTFELSGGQWVYVECCLEETETRFVVLAFHLFQSG